MTRIDTNITDAEFNIIADEHDRFMLKNAHQDTTVTAAAHSGGP
jgi:hypothetical protein